MVRQVTKSEDPCWRWGWAQNQHQGEDCFLTVEPKLLLFFPFSPTGQKLGKTFPFFLPTAMSSRPLAVFLEPQGAATTSPKGRVGSRRQPKVLIRPLPASAFSCTPLLFSHLSLSFPHIPPCLSSPSSLLLLPRLFHLLCLPGYPHSLPGWLACSQTQPHYRAPVTCLCQRREAACSPPCSPTPSIGYHQQTQVLGLELAPPQKES